MKKKGKLAIRPRRVARRVSVKRIRKVGRVGRKIRVILRIRCSKVCKL
jgi:hypothetical protein